MSATPLHDLADEFVEFRLRTEFETALWAGELAHVELWPDVAEDELRSRAETLESFSRRAETQTPGTQTPGTQTPGTRTPGTAMDRLLAETIAFTGRAQVALLRWTPELRWVSPAVGILPLVMTFLPRQPLVSDDHGERYLIKVRSFPEFAQQWGTRLESAAVSGVVPSENQVRASLVALDRWLEAPLSSGPLGAQAPPQSFDERHGEIWRAALHDALDAFVAPALRELRHVLGGVTLPAARSDIEPGLVHLDGGAEHYERLVWAHTSLDVSARAVHQIGLEQVERLAQEYVSIAGPVLGTTDLPEILRMLRDDPDLHYDDAASLVVDATGILARAGASLDGWFGVTPSAPCTANAIEQGPLAFYSRPARDGSQPGRFFFNTADPTIWGTFQLEAVTFHEGIPGHHLQLAIAQERPDLHRLLSDYYVAAYNEGWGLYTERLADEMGLYSTEIDRVGMLSADSMRACRLVVDTGLHALGWSRAQAIDFMVDNSPMTRSQVEGEVDRYIGHPGQALGYMMGRLEIDEIRRRAQSTLADRFDISAFHDTILSTGSVPLATLSHHVDGWLADQL